MILSAGDAFSLYSLATASVSTLSLCYGVAKIKGEDVRTMTGERVMALVQAGDAAAEAAFAAFCRKAAYLIFSIQALADLDAVAIGGGISRDPIVVDNIRREYLALYREPAFASIGGCPCIPADIFPCLFENDANLIGALAHHLDETGEAAI